MRNTNEKLAASIPLQSLKRYLSSSGWQSRESRKKGFDVFTLHEGAETLELILPQFDSANDGSHLRWILDALITISQYEDKSPETIAAAAKALSFDTWRSIIPDQMVKYETVPLALISSFVQNARELLQSAATTEAKPGPFFNRTTKTGIEYADRCSFGHTFAGSFGLAIQSPITSNSTPTFDFEPPEIPFERRVMERIAQGLSDISHAVKLDKIDALEKKYDTGFSANMLESFVDLAEAASEKIRFKFDLSPEWKPLSRAAGYDFTIERPHIEVAKIAARAMRLQNFERQQRVSGKVVRLKHEGNPMDLSVDFDREISVQWQSKDFGEIKVRVTLGAEEYLLAVDAHARGQSVEMDGTIERSGRNWHLLYVKNFRRVE